MKAKDTVRIIRSSHCCHQRVCPVVIEAQNRQAEITLKARDKEIDTTIRAVLGEGIGHCGQHDIFVDECIACNNSCNCNIDWELFKMLEKIKQEGIKEVVDWIRGYPGHEIPEFKLKEWGITNGQ